MILNVYSSCIFENYVKANTYFILQDPSGSRRMPVPGPCRIPQDVLATFDVTYYVPRHINDTCGRQDPAGSRGILRGPAGQRM